MIATGVKEKKKWIVFLWTEYLGALTATRPWSCVSGHPDESSYIPPPPSPVRAADSGACCVDQAAYPWCGWSIARDRQRQLRAKTMIWRNWDIFTTDKWRVVSRPGSVSSVDAVSPYALPYVCRRGGRGRTSSPQPKQHECPFYHQCLFGYGWPHRCSLHKITNRV